MKDKAMTDVLGYIVKHPNIYYRNFSSIKEDLFEGIWLDAFRYISGTFNEGKKIASYDLYEKFGDFGNLLFTSYTNEFEDALIYLIGLKNQRLVREAALQIINSDTEDAVTIMEETLLAIKDIGSDTRLSNMKEQGAKFYDRVSRIGEGITGLKTDFYKYDMFTSGLQNGELVVIAGETSQGKTSFALTMMHNIANNGGKVLIMTLEMSDVQMFARLVSQLTGINSKRILSRNCSPQELIQVKEATDEITGGNIIIHECHSAGVNYILDKIRAYKIVYNVDVVMIDYLQLVSNQGKQMSKEQQVGDIIRRLKNMTLELDIPIVVLSQLSRNKDSHKPTLSRLRDSGQIEEAADQVLFVYRPEFYGITQFDDDGASTTGKADITIAKGRNVGTAIFRMDFISHLTLFRNENEFEQPKPIINSDYDRESTTDNPF